MTRDTISKSARKNAALASALKSRFGLSGAETDIALALADGKDIVRIAQLRGVTPHTVRSQLKAIFHKTGARSQAQLVAIVLRP
jgi:DNA-binding CsgD family transcriptional regulator